MVNQNTKQPWVSATKTRAYRIGDPCLDWLALYGRDHGYVRDDDAESYDERTDFGRFVMQKGIDFEAALYRVLQGEIADLRFASTDRKLSVEQNTALTLELMQEGVAAIAQGCVSHELTRTYGYPDLLVRSDLLARMFPDQANDDSTDKSAPAIGLEGVHYRVVDIKYATLKLSAKGQVLCSSGSSAAYASQLFIYNRALGEMQADEPTTAYLMGRGFKQAAGADAGRGDSALDRLGPVQMRAVPKKGATLAELTNDAVAWYREVKTKGHQWVMSPRPSVRELHPNMGNTQDAPWHTAKKKVAQDIGELTLLWQVGVNKRNDALDGGLAHWRDVQSAQQVGVNGKSYGPMLDAILAANSDEEPTKVLPERVTAAVDVWGTPAPVEFYVDFETVNDINDDFSALPHKNGTPLIYMIGCGHIENGAWTFREFTVETLSEPAEADIIDAWQTHMRDVCTKRGFAGTPLVFHWSNAEVSTLSTAYNSAQARHPDREFGNVQWFDFLKEVVKKEPITVAGSLAFGLKSMAKAMYAHGLIETCWSDGPTDGLGAMVAAWTGDGQARERSVPLYELPLMREVVAYNEVDCRVMWEIVRYLRAHHLGDLQQQAA